MPAEFATVRAVMFDAVGTLIYPLPCVAEAYHLAAWSHGSQLTPAEIQARFPAALARAELSRFAQRNDVLSRSERRLLPTDESRERDFWRQIVADVFTDVPDHVEDLLESLWQHFAQPESWRMYHDVAAVWQTLAERGYLLGIASNFDQRLRGVLRGHPPLNRCQPICISSQIGFPKPAPEFFAGAQQQLELSPQEILLVGDDAEKDFQGASAAGWHALLLRRDSHEVSAACISTLTELLEALPQLGS